MKLSATAPVPAIALAARIATTTAVATLAVTPRLP
jgi:hypothetical protein